MTNLWIIRHGETDWNINRRLQGWTDIHLNQRGIEQANALRDYLSNGFLNQTPDIIYSSDLQRAYVTAQTVADHYALGVTQIQGLRERHYGLLEGKPWTDLKDLVERHKCAGAIELSAEEHQAESLQVFHDRIHNTLNDVIQKHQGQNVLLFSHGGSIDMMWRIAKGLHFDAAREIQQKNTAINHLQIDPELGMQVKLWGHSEHLESLV